MRQVAFDFPPETRTEANKSAWRPRMIAIFNAIEAWEMRHCDDDPPPPKPEPVKAPDAVPVIVIEKPSTPWSWRR
jgi:hypothetical protein